ncbi:MAG: hypothetical protein ABI318_00135 [Chthoniobacteraceae bacterium]
MKTNKPLLITGTITVIAAAFAAGVWAQNAAAQKGLSLWRWPDSMDSVNAAPKNHKVLFENDHVRLLEVAVQPGETEKMHGHKYPSVFMMDAPQPKTVNKNLEENAGDANRPRPPRPPHDGEADYPTCRAMTTPQAPHSITNTDTFPQHFYRMEFKKIDGDAIRQMKSYPLN